MARAKQRGLFDRIKHGFMLYVNPPEKAKPPAKPPAKPAPAKPGLIQTIKKRKKSLRDQAKELGY